MNFLVHLFSVLWKSSLLATLIFWLIVAGELRGFLFFTFVFSMLPIFLFTSFAIITSILPIVLLSNGNSFKLYFPYYAIVVFGLFFYLLLVVSFDTFVCGFVASGFVTLMQSWVWICKGPLNNTRIKK